MWERRLTLCRFFLLCSLNFFLHLNFQLFLLVSLPLSIAPSPITFLSLVSNWFSLLSHSLLSPLTFLSYSSFTECRLSRVVVVMWPRRWTCDTSSLLFLHPDQLRTLTTLTFRMIRFPLFMISCFMVHPYITSSQQLFASGPIFADHDSHLSRGAEKRSVEVAALPTVTVRGFLNFRTTVDGTVIVFTPASSSVSGASLTSIQPTSSYSSFSSSSFSSSTFSANPFTYNTPSSRNEWSASSSPLRNEWTSSSPSYTPRYRVSESSQVIEPTPSSSVSPVYPTGLVTVLAQTEVKDGLTTVHETKVIGTYIEGKYAQILRSSSFVSVGSTPTPVLPTKTFAVFPPSISSTDDSDVGRPVFDPVDNNSIEKQSNKLGTVTRITRNHRERRPPINFRSRSTETPSTPAPSRARRPTRPEGGRFGPWTPKDRERVNQNVFLNSLIFSQHP